MNKAQCNFVGNLPYTFDPSDKDLAQFQLSLPMHTMLTGSTNLGNVAEAVLTYYAPSLVDAFIVRLLEGRPDESPLVNDEKALTLLDYYNATHATSPVTLHGITKIGGTDYGYSVEGTLYDVYTEEEAEAEARWYIGSDLWSFSAEMLQKWLNPPGLSLETVEALKARFESDIEHPDAELLGEYMIGDMNLPAFKDEAIARDGLVYFLNRTGDRHFEQVCSNHVNDPLYISELGG